jgi:hypothetical protein
MFLRLEAQYTQVSIKTCDSVRIHSTFQIARIRIKLCATLLNKNFYYKWPMIEIYFLAVKLDRNLPVHSLAMYSQYLRLLIVELP